METVVGMTAIAVALLIGLGAWVLLSALVSSVANSWKRRASAGNDPDAAG